MVVLNDRVFVGSAADLVLVAQDDTGNLVDIDSDPVVDVYGPNGSLLVTGGTATRESLGTYVYPYQSASTDLLGSYRAVFTATVSGRTEKMVTRFLVVQI